MATDNNNKVLNVPNLRFPEFKEVWRDSNIGQCFDLYSGNTPSRMEKEHFVGDVNWITSGELKGHYIGDTKERISEKAATDNNLRILPVGTFVMAIYGLEAEGVRGTCSITVKTSTISQACMAFTPKSNVSNEFLYSWYKKHGNKIGIRYAQGTKQQNLSYDIIEKFPIRYPSIEEQEKLNTFISLLDKRIATQNKIIEDLKRLKVAITQKISKDKSNRKVMLSELLTERYEKNKDLYPVHSVSVSEGIINQVDYLGRSFAANDISNYNVVCCGDIVYTKSPTGDFPYGIVKMSSIDTKVSVSPLYGVYHPNSGYVGIYLHNYFSNSLNAKNYLHKLIQKGAKNTINISNKRFLENEISLPNENLLKEYSLFISAFDLKIKSERKALLLLQKQKEYLLQQMFI